MCVHLGLRESHRRRQLDRLLAPLAREVPPNAPLIVAGDFNDWRGRADALLRAAGLVEVFREAHGEHAQPVCWPLSLRLDRIYVRQVAAARPLPLPRRPWMTRCPITRRSPPRFSYEPRLDPRQPHRAADEARRLHYRRVFEAIAQAQYEVFVETFILFDDKVGRALQRGIGAREHAVARKCICWSTAGAHQTSAPRWSTR